MKKFTTHPEVYYGRRSTNWLHVLGCAAIVVTVICVAYFSGIDARGSAGERRGTQDTYLLRETAQHPSTVALRGTGTDCMEADGRVTCTNGHVYEHVRWNYGQKTIKAVVTKYSPVESACSLFTCRTASGFMATPGFSVACPRIMPLGSIVHIAGSTYRCDDRTSKRYDGRFDIFTDSYSEAKAWGKQTLEVTIGPKT